MLRFFNTLSRQVEEFHPIEDKKVRMYMCGPTVWNFAHIGNFRTFIFGDVLRRYLKFKGYDVTHVFNLTDVDDRIINEANARNISIDEFTAPWIQYFWEDFDALGMERPDVTPRATHHVAEMIDIISKLLANGHAYESEGSIYYRIAAFPEYGKLSKISFSGNREGGSDRIDTDKYDKEDARDFALWKLVGPEDQPGWDAPFGRGRPGWHIECSAMAMKYLGETFDLHAGGMDLQFPHHENEIAQSEGSTGKQFAKYWIHSEFLKIDDVTMSKSKGNFFTFRDLSEQGYSPLAMRYLLLSVPYRKQLNFTFDGLAGAEATVERLRDFRKRVNEPKGGAGSRPEVTHIVETALQEFESSMDDDFNTAAALAAIHNMVREINTDIATNSLRDIDKAMILDAIAKFDSVLGIFGKEGGETLDEEIEALITERQEARHQRNFARSDEIRDYFVDSGITIEDTKEGYRWSIQARAKEGEERVYDLLNSISKPIQVSGGIVGGVSDISIPLFNSVKREVSLFEKLRADIVAYSDVETWIVEVKLKAQSKMLFDVIARYRQYLDQQNDPSLRFWLVVLDEIPEHYRNVLSDLHIYYSSISEFKELEKLVK